MLYRKFFYFTFCAQPPDSDVTLSGYLLFIFKNYTKQNKRVGAPRDGVEDEGDGEVGGEDVDPHVDG